MSQGENPKKRHSRNTIYNTHKPILEDIALHYRTTIEPTALVIIFFPFSLTCIFHS